MKYEQIDKVSRKLLDLGYYPYQIKQIISDTVASSTTSTGSQQEQAIIDALESYVEFAIKCKTARK